MPKQKQKRKPPAEKQRPDWLDAELRNLCQDLLQRPPLRRGPFLIEDSLLQSMIAGSNLAGKVRRAA